MTDKEFGSEMFSENENDVSAETKRFRTYQKQHRMQKPMSKKRQKAYPLSRRNLRKLQIVTRILLQRLRKKSTTRLLRLPLKKFPTAFPKTAMQAEFTIQKILMTA